MKKALKPCNEPGCPNLTREGYCELHKRTKPAYDQYRESAAKRGYNSKWRQARLGYLSKHPFCVSCMMEGRRVPATVVDHIKPHKGDK
ncbi:HNH endonuclease, partial [Bacillus subtilis]